MANSVAEFSIELSDAMYRIASWLDGAPRLGSEQDSPEGARFIQLSDTLAAAWSASFKGIAAQLGGSYGKTAFEQHMVRARAQEQTERREPATGQESGSNDAVAGEQPSPVL